MSGHGMMLELAFGALHGFGVRVMDNASVDLKESLDTMLALLRIYQKRVSLCCVFLLTSIIANHPAQLSCHYHRA